MIPKIIHYCWFGPKKVPKSFQRYISDWKRICPGYRMKEWNERNFPLSKSRYASEAYREGKWAFVSDYVRFRVLYEYGGIALDTDVELVKPLEAILGECEEKGCGGFMGIERAETGDVNPGLICGTEPHNPFIREVLQGYKDRSFKDEALRNKNEAITVVEYITDILEKHGFKRENVLQNAAGFLIYPTEYFSPMDMSTGLVNKTSNTVSIHHFASSWVDPYSRFRGKIYKRIRRCFGADISEKVRKAVGRK